MVGKVVPCHTGIPFNMEVGVTTWLFIGMIFGFVLLVASLCGYRRSFRSVDDPDPREQKRRHDQHAQEVSGIRAYRRGPDGGLGLS